MGSQRRFDWGVVLCSVALLVLCLGFLAQLKPSETATVEQLLPPNKTAELAELRRRYGDAGDFALITAQFSTGNPEIRRERIRELEQALAHTPGVRRT